MAWTINNVRFGAWFNYYPIRRLIITQSGSCVYHSRYPDRCGLYKVFLITTELIGRTVLKMPSQTLKI